MKFRPRLNKSLLTSRQCAARQLDWFNSENRRILLVVSMKMWFVMTLACFPVHPDNDTKEATELRHSVILPTMAKRAKDFPS
jgi:hypothetical protein